MGSESCYFSASRGCNGDEGLVVKRKRVITLIDHSSRAKQAMMWALTHVANRGDLLTLLSVVHHPVDGQSKEEKASHLANSLVSLCKACKPEVEVEALVIQGPKQDTVLSQVKKLEASVLSKHSSLSESKPSPSFCLFRSSREEFLEQCINKAECLTMAVRKQQGSQWVPCQCWKIMYEQWVPCQCWKIMYEILLI